jgi:hypothetical protein
VYHKPSGRVLPLQVKARTVTLKRAGSESRANTVHFEVRKVVVARNRRTHLLAVLLGQEATRIEVAWLMPLAQLPSVARAGRDKYVVRASGGRLKRKSSFLSAAATGCSLCAIR